MNRRGFISSLAGLAVWEKSGFSLPPAASAIQPTCEGPYMSRIEFLNGTTEECERHLERYSTERVLRWGTQAVFPVIGDDGKSHSLTAYVLCEDWANRRSAWLSTKPDHHVHIQQRPTWDAYALGRGEGPLTCYCDACRKYFADEPGHGHITISHVVCFGGRDGELLA